MPSPSSISRQQSLYLWQGCDARGQPARGEISGVSIALVRAQLRQQGLRPTRVWKKTSSVLKAAQPRIRPLDIAVFTRQLATMTKAGIPLLQAFEIVAEGLENAALRAVLQSIRADVAAGNAFSAALRGQSRHFDELYCSLIEAGEQSGTLDIMLDRLAHYREKSEALKAKIRKALNYPVAVLCVALIVTGILLVKVVPQFAGTFASFGAELPLFTQFVLQLSELAIRSWSWILLGLSAMALLWGRARRRSPAFAAALERLSLRLPVLGALLAKSALARFTRTLSTTFAAGLPLVDALNAAAGAAGNVVFRQASCRIRDDVSHGQSLQQAMRATQRFPALVLQMVAIGEESGALDAMLDKCASFYEAEVDNAVDGLSALMEPFIMALLGVLVGGLMIAMYLPIFRIGAVI